MQKTIIVLDFGAQYGHLIANRIRRLGAYSEILPHDTSVEELRAKNACGIILSGGPKSVYEDDGLSMDPKIFDLNIPVLGICYGHQLLVHMLGGTVERGTVHEFGKSELTILKKAGILSAFPDHSIVWMSHVDRVTSLPPGFETIGTTADCEMAVIMNTERQIYGVQFHPEVTHTEKGLLVLQNFVRLCGAENSWQIADFVTEEVVKIQTQALGKKVFLLVSGGVDSSVAFALLEKALGKERVYGLFIDHGLLRKNEAVEVKTMLENAGFINLHVRDASTQFLKNLENIADPEKKREVIGNTFLDVQAEVAKELDLNPDEWLLGQGTIYPDTIETGGTKHASKIKTHHNRVERIQELMTAGKIIEPLRDLYKDEVRAVGRKLGLSEQMIARQPFPGPGLGVRILCAEGANVLPNAAEIEEKIIQKFPEFSAQILPVKSVGVQGDFRSYRHPVVLFSPEQPNWTELESTATAIINTFPELNRVLLCVSHPTKLPAAEVAPAYLISDRITLLQEADAIVREVFAAENFSEKEQIWQFPVVLCPVSFGQGGEAIILRPVESQEAMTANFGRLPWELVQHMSKTISDRLAGQVSAIFYDITNKPPGTIEWE